MRLATKTALVTGGTTGIGHATAEAFKREGARVAITGQNPSRVAQTTGFDLAVVSDAAKLDDIDGAMATVREKFGHLDILFVNAGIFAAAPVDAVSAEHFDSLFATNVRGVFFTIQKALPIMREGGSIVVNTSINASLGMEMASVYSATKAAARSLVRSFALELLGRKIRVNAVAPGPIETPIFGKTGMPPEMMQQMAEGIRTKVPMQRFGQSREVADAVLFLASDEASFITGQELAVDGGWLGVGR